MGPMFISPPHEQPINLAPFIENNIFNCSYAFVKSGNFYMNLIWAPFWSTDLYFHLYANMQQFWLLSNYAVISKHHLQRYPGSCHLCRFCKGNFLHGDTEHWPLGMVTVKQGKQNWRGKPCPDTKGSSGGSDGKVSACNTGDSRDMSSIPAWVRKIPWRGEWPPTPVFLPGKSYGQRGLAATVHGVAKSWTRLSDTLTLFQIWK